VARADGASVRIGQTQHGDLSLSLDQLNRHTAVFGATGAGKSTLLLHLALGLLETPIGATILDPHGDLATDLLSRVPAHHAKRVHVLRLADKAHPRGFNFLERREADEAQLVTSEFVELFEDLWPKFCGPKMQHYLRQALLTLLSHPEPQTVIELVRVLTDDSLRDEYLDHVDGPMLSAFWRTEWPGPRERDRDTSIKAVLNKLGAFVSYGSIRQVVGQGVSTLRPRQVMDAGDLLVVDLSRVGGDNAQLFGAMLISRYYVDAVGRQGTSAASRRPHLLIVDEAQRFSTRAVEKISVEGRKFGLLLCLATQSLTALPLRLRSTRRVSPNIYRASEFERMRREANPAIEQILSSPMTVLKGELAAA
jgi:energy-coupling factor transporter ATP-binding protein EcfA2